MLGGFVSAFRTPDLRRKLLFTLGVLALYRLGASIPTPGVDYVAVQQCIKLGDSTSVVQLINAFSGGALLRLSVFALGVMPYITASIIVQLLRTLIPRFQALHEEGQDGQAKLTQYTRYITIGFAAMQSASYITLARNGLLLQNCQSPLLVERLVVRHRGHDPHDDGRNGPRSCGSASASRSAASATACRS